MARLGALLVFGVLALAACGDDGSSSSTTATAVNLEVQSDLVVGDTYEAGGVSLTVHGVERSGGLVIADAEACTDAGAPAGLPVETAAWQLVTEPGEPAVVRSVLDDPPPAARPEWPDRLSLAGGDCFRGKVPFEVDADPTAVVFTQLGQPVSWGVAPP